MNAVEGARHLKAAGCDRFDHLQPHERVLYHRDSFAVGYSLGVVDHLKWQREHTAAAQATLFGNNDAEADGA